MPREYYNHFKSLNPLHTCPNIFSTQPMNHKRIIASPSFRVFLEKERLHFLWFSHKLHQIIFHFPDTALICVLLVWQRAAVYEWNQTSGGKQSRERHKYKTMIANINPQECCTAPRPWIGILVAFDKTRVLACSTSLGLHSFTVCRS